MSPAAIAKKMTPGMRILLARHAEGWKSSLYFNQYRPADGHSPYWAAQDCTYAPPIYHVREALIRRMLIEPYDDAAGITDLGRKVHAILTLSPGEPK